MPSYKMVSSLDGYEDHATIDAPDEFAARVIFKQTYGLSDEAKISATELVKNYDEAVFEADLVVANLRPHQSADGI